MTPISTALQQTLTTTLGANYATHTHLPSGYVGNNIVYTAPHDQADEFTLSDAGALTSIELCILHILTIRFFPLINPSHLPSHYPSQRLITKDRPIPNPFTLLDDLHKLIYQYLVRRVSGDAL